MKESDFSRSSCWSGFDFLDGSAGFGFGASRHVDSSLLAVKPLDEFEADTYVSAGNEKDFAN